MARTETSFARRHGPRPTAARRGSSASGPRSKSQPRRRRPTRRAVDGRMARVPLCDGLVAAHDPVLVAEARTAQVGAARPDGEHVVELGRLVIADVNLGRESLEATLADRCVSAGK